MLDLRRPSVCPSSPLKTGVERRGEEGEERAIKRREGAELGFFFRITALLALHQHIVQPLKAKINEVFRDLWQHAGLRSDIASDPVSRFCTSKVSSIILGAASCRSRIYRTLSSWGEKAAGAPEQHVSVPATASSRSNNCDGSKDGRQAMFEKTELNPNYHVSRKRLFSTVNKP